MYRLVSILVAAMLSASAVFAQEKDAYEASFDRPDHPFSIGLQGGALFSLYENAFSYTDNGKTMDLFTPQGAITLGYNFTGNVGARLSASYARNAGACNTLQTSARGFYPYTFSSVNVFADCLLNLSHSWDGFSPVLYAGLGGAHTFAFTDPHHPWQGAHLTQSNWAFGFRFGFIAEYDFTSHVGIYADLCGEAYTDGYNGLQPTKEDKEKVKGYPGFPFDLRALASLGVIFHF